MEIYVSHFFTMGYEKIPRTRMGKNGNLDTWTLHRNILILKAYKLMYLGTVNLGLDNDTILRPKEHFVDQHGYTDQLFGLCHLLGYSLMPRLTVSKHNLYKLDRTKSYGPLDAVLRGTVDVALIREQWDQLVRVARSLRKRTAHANVVLTPLASSAPSDRLAKALTALGQALKTL